MPLRSVATLEERPRGLMAWHGAWGAETQAIRLPDSLGLALLGGGGRGRGLAGKAGKLLSRTDGATFCVLLPLLICIEP